MKREVRWERMFPDELEAAFRGMSRRLFLLRSVRTPRSPERGRA